MTRTTAFDLEGSQETPSCREADGGNMRVNVKGVRLLIGVVAAAL